MARSKHKESANFSGIPRHIVEHSSFKSLGYSACKLLILLGYQYKGFIKRSMVEGQGFEPWKGISPCWFSRPVHSAALPSLRKIGMIQFLSIK